MSALWRHPRVAERQAPQQATGPREPQVKMRLKPDKKNALVFFIIVEI
jgi:hypothetical protein